MSLRTLLRISLVATPLALSGCGLDKIFGAPLLAIELQSEGSSAAIVEVGDTVRVSTLGRVGGVVGIFSYDRVYDAVWRSSDTSVARVPRRAQARTDVNEAPVSSEALIWGERVGTARVTATARGVVGDIAVRVIPPIARLEIESTRASIVVGDTIEITPRAVDTLGNVIENVPTRLESDSAVAYTWRTDRGWRLVAKGAGRPNVTVRFHRTAARLDLVVTQR